MLSLAACGAEPFQVDEGFFGGVAADEARAALVMRDILVEGGRAADAAVAGFFALSVTLPSSAGLAATGACIVFDPSTKRYERIGFPAVPSSSGPRPVAMPTAPRAMFALHARYGRLVFESLIAEAERLARFGEPVSKRLADDLRWIEGAPPRDPTLRSILMRPDGTPRRRGDPMEQIDLGAMLGRLRSAGVGDLYVGPTARLFAEAVQASGFDIDQDRLRGALPVWSEVQSFVHDNHNWSVVGPDLAAEHEAMTALEGLFDTGGFGNRDAAGRAELLARFTAAGNARAGGPYQPDVPGATSFVAIDRRGQAVACSVGMERPFGLMRTAEGMGVVLRPVTESGPAAAYAVIAGNRNTWQLNATASASGGTSSLSALLQSLVLHYEDDLPVADAVAAKRSHQGPGDNAVYVEPGLPDGAKAALGSSGNAVREVPVIGQASVFRCVQGIPREAESCDLAGDSRGGLVLFERD